MIDMYRWSVANFTFQRGHDREFLVDDLAPRSDVILGVEARTGGPDPFTLPVGMWLGPDWLTIQYRHDAAKGAAVLAVRRSTGIQIRRHRLIQLNEPGGGVMARHMLVGILDFPGFDVFGEVAVAHLPVEATGKQGDAMRRVAQWRRAAAARRRRDGRVIAFGGDVNMPPLEFADELNMPNQFGAKPMIFTWGNGWRVERGRVWRRRPVDHGILTVTGGPR